jgi:hypothetical protein
MRGGLTILAGAVAAAGAFALCPSAIRADMAERTGVPEHVYLEAERQLTVFINWARNDGARPGRDDHRELAT